MPVVLVERRSRGEKSLLYELRELAEAAGYCLVGEVSQIREQDPRYNIGSGKVKELAELVRGTGARKVIFFNELKPHQTYNLAKTLKVEVIDRFDLILEVFAKRAGSREAKLQIELARLRRGLSFAREYLRLAKIGELHGFMGGGEYAIDAYYKHVRQRISKIEDKLAKLRAQKSERWARRSGRGLFYISITGYTGAGKTTLFKALTGYAGYVDNKPFATLSTKLKRVLMGGRPVVISDTVGFIDCLPPQLLDAFYTTLGEVTLADLVLLVFDVSEEAAEIKRKLEASLYVLQSIGVSKSRVLAVANKIDLVHKSELEGRLELAREVGVDPVPVSALTGEGIKVLEERALELMPGYASLWVTVPFLEALKGARVYVRGIVASDGAFKVLIEGRREWVTAFAAKYSSVLSEDVADRSS